MKDIHLLRKNIKFNNDKDINAPVLPKDKTASELFSVTEFIASDMLEFFFDFKISEGLSSIAI